MLGVKPSTRVISNTLVLLGKTVFGIVSGIVVTRALLAALGADDFGLFMTIGASSGLLMVLTNALSDASSRYMSHALGAGDRARAASVFNTALAGYAGLALVVGVLGVALAWPVGVVLKAPESRGTMDVALLFLLAAGSFAVVTLTSPFTSAAISAQRMNILASADVAVSVMRLVGAVLLPFVPMDELMAWAWFTLLSQVAGAAMTMAQTGRAVDFARVRPSLFDRRLVPELMSFGGWQVLGALSWRLRAQGAQILLNQMFGDTRGPKVNASFGVGAQLAGFQSALATPVQQAVYPVTIASHGGGNVRATHDLLLATGKFTFLATAVASAPLVVEAPGVLAFWLGAEQMAKLPWVVDLTRLIALAVLVDTITRGFIHGVNATGRLGVFTLVNLAIDAATLVAGGLLIWGLPPADARWLSLVTLGLVVVQGAFRVLYGGRRVGLGPGRFVRESLLPGIGVFGACVLSCWALTRVMPAGLPRMLVSGGLSAAVLVPLVWAFATTEGERSRLRAAAAGAMAKIRRKRPGAAPLSPPASAPAGGGAGVGATGESTSGVSGGESGGVSGSAGAGSPDAASHAGAA